MNHQMPYVIVLLSAVVCTVLMQYVVRIETPKIGFSAPPREALVAVIPLSILVVLTTIVFLGASATESSVASEVQRTSYTLGNAVRQLFLNAAIFLPFGITMLVRKQGLSTIGMGLRNLRSSLLVGLSASLVAIAVFGKLDSAFWFSADTLYRLIAQVGVGMSEEAIFRGYLQSRFSAWLGSDRGWLLVAAVFALVHIPQRMESGISGNELAVDMIVLVIWGLAFGWAMKKMGNIAGLIFLHAVMNLVGP